MYARVVGGVVVQVLPALPESTESISGFPSLSTQDQIAHGYFPFVEEKPAFNPDTEKLEGPAYTIGASQITATYSVVSLSASELAVNLEVAKTARLAAIESAYQEANSQPIAYMGTTFQADDSSTTLMTKTVTIMQGTGTASCTWWDSANNGVPLTLAQLIGLGAVIFVRGQGYFAHKQSQKGAIRTSSTVAQVQGVTW